MRSSSKNHVSFQWLASAIRLMALVSTLAACTMPEKPEGADDSSMVNMANRMRASGDDAGAVDFYQRGIAMNPNDIGARKGLAEILDAHGDDANAAMEYREALKMKPDDAGLHRALGRILIKQGQFADAKDEYEKALTSDSDDIRALNGLGIAMDNLGQHDAAQKMYRQALDNKSDDLMTINNLAHSYVLTGAYDQAIQMLEPHVKDKSATPAMRQNLAEAYGMSGMFVDAERMARMDLSSDQVKHNMDYYRARRAKLAVGPALYADLGSFATKALADEAVDDVRTNFAKESDGLVVEAKTEVKVIGGTPNFNVYVTGFAHAQRLQAFCEILRSHQMACKPHDK
jgi:Flp pilus assembly protein TadD